METLAHRVESKDDAVDNIYWSNSDNKEFYENFSFEEYQKYLALAGLANNPDIELIKDLILSANSILDVGPGYGRVIESTKNIGYKRRLTAVEFSQTLASNLKSKFINDDIIHADFLKFTVNKKFDLILMMWTTISVFNPFDEQQACFHQCAKMLSDDGYCVIDLMIRNNAKDAIAHVHSKTDVTVGVNHTIHYGYGPSVLELIRYVAKAGLAVRQIKEYQAGVAERCLVILGKS